MLGRVLGGEVVQLGADPTAIYRHFRDKDELVVELADRAFGSLPVPDPALS